MLCTKHIIVFSHFSYCVVWWGVEPDKHYKKTVHPGEDNKKIIGIICFVQYWALVKVARAQIHRDTHLPHTVYFKAGTSCQNI